MGNGNEQPRGQQNSGSKTAASQAARTTRNSSAEAPTSTTSPAAIAQEVEEGRLSAQFDALRNAIYHTARGHHFAASHRRLMLLVVATGTAGVAGLAESIVGSKMLAAATAVLAALDLVMDLKGRASQHGRLKQEYYTLLASIESTPQPDASKVRRWRGKIVRLTAEEPKTYRAVDAIAYNNAVDALGRDEAHRLQVPLLVAVLAHFWPFSARSFQYDGKDQRGQSQ